MARIASFENPSDSIWLEIAVMLSGVSWIWYLEQTFPIFGEKLLFAPKQALFSSSLEREEPWRGSISSCHQERMQRQSNWKICRSKRRISSTRTGLNLSRRSGGLPTLSVSATRTSSTKITVSSWREMRVILTPRKRAKG